MDTLHFKLQFDVLGSGLSQTQGILGGIHSQIGGINSQFQNLGRGGISQSTQQIQIFQNQMQSLSQTGSSSISGLSSSFSGLGVAISGVVSGIKLAAQLIAEVYTRVDQFTDKAIEVFGERTSTIRSYATILKDPKQAEQEYLKAGALAQKTELTQDQVINIQSRLIRSGFRGQDEDKALFNIVDLVSSLPQNQRLSAANRASDIYGDISSRGKMTGRDVNRIAQFLNVGTLYEEIGKQMGVKKGDVEGLISKGKVNDQVALSSIQHASNQQLGTNKLGEFATGAAGNLTAMLSNKEEAFTNLLRTIDSETLPGVKRYKDAINNLTDSMNVSTESGKNLRFFFEDISDFGANMKSVKDEFLTGFIKSFGESYKQAIDEFGMSADDSKSSMDNLTQAAKAVGEIAGKVGYLVGALKAGLDSLGLSIGNSEQKIGSFKSKAGEIVEVITQVLGQIFENIKNMVVGVYKVGHGAYKLNWAEVKEGADLIGRAGKSGVDDFMTGNIFNHKDRFYDDSYKFFKDQYGRGATIPQMLSAYQDKLLGKKPEGAGSAAGSSGDTPDWGPGSEKSGSKGGKGNASGSGSGQGGKGGSGGQLIPFDYATGNMMSIPPPSSSQYRPYSSDAPIHIDKIEITISGGSSNPSDIADAVYQKLAQQVSRLSRNPRVSVM